MGGWYELATTWFVRKPREFADSSRGQSQVLGAILIFSFVVSGLGLYQAVIVPQQTSEVELQHSMQVKDDFADVHSAITNAGSQNDLQTASVKLGTRYPPRALTLNPAPASGRLAIDGLGSGIDLPNAGVTMSAVCGTTDEVKTLTYEAGYNRLTDAGHHGYETSVTYEAANGKIVDSDQVLVQGTTVRLLPLTAGTASTTGLSSETLEFEGGTTGGTTVSAPLIISLPTELSADQWRTVLADAEKVSSITKPTSDTVVITLEPDTYTVRCTPIGEGKSPDNSPTVFLGDGGNSNGSDASINPNGEGSVAYKTSSMADDDGDNVENGVVVTFENLDDETRTIKEVRVPFYTADSQGGSGGTAGQKVDARQDGVAPFEDVGGPYVSRPDVTLAPRTNVDNAQGVAPRTNVDNEGEVQVDFFCSDSMADEYPVGIGDYFVLSLKFENGQTNKYFINPPAEDPGNNPCGGGTGENNGNPNN